MVSATKTATFRHKKIETLSTVPQSSLSEDDGGQVI